MEVFKKVQTIKLKQKDINCFSFITTYDFTFTHTTFNPESIISDFISQHDFHNKLNQGDFPAEQLDQMLGVPFDNNYFSYGDLKNLTVAEFKNLIKHFGNRYNSNYWKEDPCFSGLGTQLFDFIDKRKINTIYFASINEFRDSRNDKLRIEQATSYIFYFIAFWFDLERSALTICEWAED